MTAASIAMVSEPTLVPTKWRECEVREDGDLWAEICPSEGWEVQNRTRS